MRIRPETPADRDAIAAVATAAFGREDEARMVESIRRSEAFVAGLSLVAEEEGEVVGHVLLGRVHVNGRPVLQLGPLGVLPERQGAGIGSALVRAALRAAEGRGEPLVLVLGHPSYYRRFGFRPAAALRIDPPDPAWNRAFMALPLRAHDAALSGRLTLPPAYGTA